MKTITDIIESSRTKRLASVPPRFLRIHVCPQCKQQFYCPDRYDFPECGPSRYMAQKFGVVNTLSGCLPCVAELSTEERVAWYEAHGVDVPRGTLSQ